MIVNSVNRKKSVKPSSDSGEQREEQNEVADIMQESEFCAVDEQKISCANAVAEQEAESNREVAVQNAERSNAVVEQKMPFSNGETDFTIDREFMKKNLFCAKNRGENSRAFHVGGRVRRQRRHRGENYRLARKNRCAMKIVDRQPICLTNFSDSIIIVKTNFEVSNEKRSSNKHDKHDGVERRRFFVALFRNFHPHDIFRSGRFFGKFRKCFSSERQIAT